MMCDKTIVAVKVAKAELELAKDLFGVGAILKDLESGAIVDLTDEEFISARHKGILGYKCWNSGPADFSSAFRRLQMRRELADGSLQDRTTRCAAAGTVRKG
jgi:hypothetical protein